MFLDDLVIMVKRYTITFLAAFASLKSCAKCYSSHKARISVSGFSRRKKSAGLASNTYNLGLARLIQLFRLQKRILDGFVYALVWAAGECIVVTIRVGLSFFRQFSKAVGESSFEMVVEFLEPKEHMIEYPDCG